MEPTEEEFMRAYDAYGEALFRHSYYRVFDRERAKELVQDAFIRTWEYIQQGHKVENLRAFLYRVLNNLIINESKKKKTLALEALQEQGFDPSFDPRHAIEISLEVKRVRKLLELLEPRDRDIILMRYVDDLGPRDISLITGETENVISVRLHRAVKSFRALLDSDYGEYGG